MAKRVPRNKSLTWSILGAGSVAAVGYQLFKIFGYHVNIGPLISFGGQATVGTVGLMAVHNYISSLPWRRFKVTCENVGLYIDRESGIRLPKLRRKEKKPWGWRLWYKIPIGLAAIQFGEKQEQFEAALDAEVNFSYRKGLLRVDILLGRVPDHIGFDKIVSMGANSFQVEFHALMNSLPFELPFIVGYGRQGWLYSGLVDCPHLLVAGQTGAGKSNFLHTLISCLMQVDCVIHIIDLKRVEFSYLKKHLTVKHSLNGAIETLEFLTAEMQRRMAFLDRAGFVSAKEWRKTHPDRANELPYHVLVIDEFSQLCPMLAKEKNDRMVRTYAHKMLVDLICLARSLGIHVVIATQRPDQHILPGQLKANIPATLCFRVRSTTNSQICLDRNGAEKLPSPKEIPGRAIWQHDEEREVQTMYMPINQAKTLMQSQRSKNVIEQACQMGRFRGGMVCSG